MKKVFVNLADNRIETHLREHFNLRDHVIVKDGSYMLDEHGRHVNVIHFRHDGNYELLKIVEVNKAFPTYYKESNETLGHQNNCCIEGGDGSKYYCSKINIVRFSLL